MRDRNKRAAGAWPNRGPRQFREEGAIVKDWGGRLPVALVYPNSYYLGMSNLGIQVIYRLLNDHDNIVCERVFHEPKARDTVPVSVESGRPLADFAVIAFSVSYELDYFNMPAVLRAAGIPLRASERDERHPLVIAGGPCVTANPMPLSPFFDCLGIGEAEAILPPMLPILARSIGDKREALLRELASVTGLYIPACHYPDPVARRWAQDLDSYPACSTVLTPDTELGDLYLIEVERGCARGCRFCLVHGCFSPMRFRSVKSILEQARSGLRYRRRVGLVGPAVADHPQIEEIVTGLRRLGAELSVSSLRIGAVSPGLLRELAAGGVRTITLAPEAGSERLRHAIRKNVTRDEILDSIAKVAGQGIRRIKLYFMLGLPSETDEDIDEIVRLVQDARSRIERQRSSARLALNIAPFVPKAGTPFQWLPMAPVETLERRLSLLRKALSPRGIKIKAESPAWSHVQAALARGDTAMADVICDLENVSLSGWRRALERHRLDIEHYVNHVWGVTEPLPWDVIDSGVSPDHLRAELQKALTA